MIKFIILLNLSFIAAIGYKQLVCRFLCHKYYMYYCLSKLNKTLTLKSEIFYWSPMKVY